jgi:hypothetical protein
MGTVGLASLGQLAAFAADRGLTFVAAPMIPVPSIATRVISHSHF